MVDEMGAIHSEGKEHLGKPLYMWKANPCSAIGSVANQPEAPFSVETCIALFMSLVSFSSTSAAAAKSRCFRCLIASLLAVNCCALASWWYIGDCSEMREIRGAVMFFEDWW